MRQLQNQTRLIEIMEKSGTPHMEDPGKMDHDCRNKIYQLFKDMTMDIVSGHENAGIIRDIISSKHGHVNHSFKETHDILSGIQKKDIDHYLKSNKSIINTIIEVGKHLLSMNKFNDAVAAFEDVLFCEPDNKFVYDILSRHVAYSRDFSIQLQILQDKFCFDYVKTIGRDIIQSAKSAVYFFETDRILVSDFETSAIEIFDMSGIHRKTLNLKLDKPMGLFLGNDSTFWICDWGNREIKQSSVDGDLLNVIKIQSDSVKSSLKYHPFRGTTYENELYLIVTDEHFGNRSVLVIGNNGLQEFIPIQEPHVNDLQMINGRLFINNSQKGDLFYYDRHRKKFIVLNKNPLPGICHTFTFVGNHFYLTCNNGNGIAKLSRNGRTVFIKNDMKDLFAVGTFSPGVQSFSRGQEDFIILTDQINNCLHLFRV